MTTDQQIQTLKRSVQQLSQRICQMSEACRSLQRVIADAGIDHPGLSVEFPLPTDPENLPELHAYEQCQALKAAGLISARS